MMKNLLAAFFLLSASTASWSECMTFSTASAKAIAEAINTKLIKLESARPEPLTKPTVLLKLSEVLNPVDTNDVPIGSDSAKEELKKIGCLDGRKVNRSIMLAAQGGNMQLEFISPDTDAFVQEAVDRIGRIGHTNIDPSTVSGFAARDINYVVVIGGRIKALKYKCTFNFEFDADIDIHSIATRQISPISITTELDPHNAGRYVKFGVQRPYPEKLLLQSTSNTPLCLGKVTVTANNKYEQYRWSEEIGCIPAGSQIALAPPHGIELRPTWYVRAQPLPGQSFTCDLWEFGMIYLNRD